MKITFAGGPLTLVGSQVKVGDKVDNFQVMKNDLSMTNLTDFEGLKVISVVPSLDTGVCDMQTRKFNQELSDKNINILTISNDLPFAQARWCGASGIDNVVTLSDYLLHDCAAKLGILIEELKLLTRAVFILDANNEVLYVEYLEEITNHPNYDAVITKINELT